MEIKHTPGPWQFDEIATTCGRAFRIGAGEMLKAGKGCCIIYDDYHGNPENERKANARLIAAAPELYEALKAVYAWQESDGDDEDEAEAARGKVITAIAKAEGRS